MGTLTWLGLQRVTAAQSPPPSPTHRILGTRPSRWAACQSLNPLWLYCKAGMEPDTGEEPQLSSVRPGPEASLAERSL